KSGEDLGEAKNTIKAKKYNVSVKGPKAMGPKPKVWKEGVGLVDVENAIAVDQIVEFTADVQPAPTTGPVKHQWNVTSGPCTVSNPISPEVRTVANAAGGCELSVVIRDKNDIELGQGKGSFSATVSRETIKQGQDKAKNVDEAKKKLQSAKGKAAKGDYDGAVKDVDEACRLDPSSKEAADTARRFRQDKATLDQQISKAKKLMDENRYADALKELTAASNLNRNYPPIRQANKELNERWERYNNQVREKLLEVRSASEKKEFGKALEIASAWRASTKLDPAADQELKKQEDFARQQKAQKDKQIGILKTAAEKAKNYDYAGAVKSFDEGFANSQDLFNGTEPEYQEAVKLRESAVARNKRLNELIPGIRKAAEDKSGVWRVDMLESAARDADEAIGLQPNNGELKRYKELILTRLAKTKEENARLAEGKKYLEAGRAAHGTAQSQLSRLQSYPNEWGEKIEESIQDNLRKAVDNYRKSLQYIPDPKLEAAIKELQANLDGRSKFLTDVRKAKELRAEGDTLVQQAGADPDFEGSQGKYTKAVEKYRQSLALWRPPDAETLGRIIWATEVNRHDRAVRKYWADGQALETEGRLVEAIGAYDKAVASFHPSVEQKDRLWITHHVQELRNRVDGAKRLRAEGDAKEKAGKIAEAIASFRQSLKLVPDATLEDHVKALEAGMTRENAKKAAADRLWQEGTTLLNGGRLGDALTKYTESLRIWSDESRAKTVRDLEGRKAAAQKLRDEGSGLEKAGRLKDAVGKYRESLKSWPDPVLEKHIASLDAAIAAQNQIKTTPPVGSGSTAGTTSSSGTSGAESVPVDPAKAKTIFDNGNKGGVDNKPTAATTFTVQTPHVITLIANYHWNSGRGSRPGTISLRGGSGRTYGPWQATGSPGQGGVPNANWTCKPNITLPPGTYTVVDSDPATWAQNSGSQGRGFTRIEGYPVSAAEAATPSVQTSSGTQAPASIMAEITNRSTQNAHIFTEGESFGPANRFAPGEKRKTPVRVPPNGLLTFKAGRNGKVMATKTWQSDPGATGRVPVVVFDDSNPFGMLTISTGLR
ncbi:MAG TPA: hypothetical protein PKV86_03740, partial [Syntrophobacteraceae bacterium]|nr:hypothetical protein [Syntrophobacteraceae bacterium]